MGEQRGLAPLLTVDLAPVTVELNLRESGARFPCKWSSVLEIYMDLEIRLKAPFRDHLDIFENGAQTDCFPSADFDYDRLGAVIYGDYYAG